MDHTKQKSVNPTATQLEGGERREQTSGTKGGSVSCGGARMLLGTSYLFPLRCWALSWAHQPIQTPSLWRGVGHGQMSTLVVPKTAWSWVLALRRQRLAAAAHPQHIHGMPTAAMATGKINCCFLACPSVRDVVMQKV